MRLICLVLVPCDDGELHMRVALRVFENLNDSSPCFGVYILGFGDIVKCSGYVR
jgi:hypothetical protein